MHVVTLNSYERKIEWGEKRERENQDKKSRQRKAEKERARNKVNFQYLLQN